MNARTLTLPLALFMGLSLAGCATFRPPEITYDENVPSLPAPPPPVVEQPPRPVHTPPAWTPSRGGERAQTPEARVVNANAAARVEPRREGYYNAIQIFPWSEGALYQVYAAPGQITDIALEPGERLIGEGPIAAGDTARWIIGDTRSGSGRTERVHILVKPTRPEIATNLVINTDRRTYLVELSSDEETYMPSVAWAYPPVAGVTRPPAVTRPEIPPTAQRRHRYALEGDRPPWRPRSVFDDGRRVYIVFPRGIVQGDMPPLFLIGADGGTEIANTRVHRNVLIVDRLFAAAELRLGGRNQQTVRIVRTDGVQRRPAAPQRQNGESR